MKSSSLLIRSIPIVSLILLSSLISSAQNFPVAGKVTAASGEPLAGVTIQVKNGKGSATTKADGTFEINAPGSNAVLIFTYVGYEEQQVSVNNRGQITVSLSPATAALENVVVIGYGTQKRKNVTGAVSTFDARRLEEQPMKRVDQALVGQLAGVTVKQTTGVPGKAFSVQVRGSGSITAGNEPLYVIDGFPLSNNSSNTGNGSFVGGNPLDNINPNDIENIEVLKDAAAAAIYGSRASNGVVLITTRRGQTGRPKISFNNSVGFNEANKKLKMLNGSQWIDRATEMINSAYVLRYGSAGATANDDAAKRTSIVGAFNAAYFLDPRWSMPGNPGLEFMDWQDVIEQRGIINNHAISASGGSDVVRYYISG